MNDPQTRGSRVFRELTGHDPETALATIRRQSPQMHDWLLSGAFGQPLADPRLPGRDRELATVAMLVALGDTAPQLRVHFDAALHHGATADELRQGLTWHMWEPIVRDLACGRRVFAYDLRGHGAAADAPPPADLTTLADDLQEVLDHEGLTGAHVVGLA